MEFKLTIGDVEVGDDEDARQARICLVSTTGGTASIGSLGKPCPWGCLVSRHGKRTLTGLDTSLRPAPSTKEWDLCGLSIITEDPEGSLSVLQRKCLSESTLVQRL